MNVSYDSPEFLCLIITNIILVRIDQGHKQADYQSIFLCKIKFYNVLHLLIINIKFNIILYVLSVIKTLILFSYQQWTRNCD